MGIVVHHLPASSQGKTVNLLLGMGAGNGGRSRSTPCGRSSHHIFSRENHKLVIGKKWWDVWVIAPQILLKGKAWTCYWEWVMGFQGDREALPTSDRVWPSSQGKSVNHLLGIGEGISDGHHLPASSQGNYVKLIGTNVLSGGYKTIVVLSY